MPEAGYDPLPPDTHRSIAPGPTVLERLVFTNMALGRNMGLLAVSLAALIGLFLGAPLTASAAGPGSFMAYPSKIESSAAPGQTLVQSVRVRNDGDESIQVESALADYYIRKDNTFVFLPVGARSYSSSTWVSYSPRSFTIPPKVTKDIRITISVPGSAEPGGHYSTVIFKTKAQQNDSTGVSIVSAVAVQLLTVVGDPSQIKRQGDVVAFSSRNGRFDRNVRSTVTFGNQGNVHLSLKGKVVYTDIFGRKLASEPVQSITVLPGTERSALATWTGPFIGRVKAKATLEYGPDLYTFNTRRTSEEVTFWIIPWREAGLIVIVFLLIALLRLTIRKRRPSGGDPSAEAMPKERAGAA